MDVVRVGVTGHRILADESVLSRSVDLVLKRIGAQFPNSRLLLVSPLAEGADRLVAHRLLACPGTRLEVPLPLPHETYVEDFDWGPEERRRRSREEFHDLLGQAERVFELPPAPTRDEAYDRVGSYILDNCDVLIAVWDGEGAQGEGGTGDIVARARRRGLPLAWIHAGNRRPGTTEATSLGPEQGKVTFEHFA